MRRLRRLILLTTLFVLGFAAFASAQTVAHQDNAPRARKVTVSGKISDDGRAILGGEGRAWLVSNAEKLRNHLGENVTVKGFLDPITSRIEVLSMKRSHAPVSASARLGDSAFRR
jgi:hypothetical protein